MTFNQKEASMATTHNDVTSWRGQNLIDSHDDKVGKIEEIYLDADSDMPEWALVTTGMFGSKQSFVPIEGATEREDGIHVPFEKATVKDAPKVEPDGALSPQEENELYRHYGRDSRSASSEDTPLASDERGGPGTDTSGPNTDDAMTLSEEQLRVGTTEREAGRVRLKKYVVEDEVTKTVPVRREEVRIEREPITDANRGDALAGPDISEEEHEVVLHEETVSVDKQAVAKERVRLDKDVTTDEQTVSDTVRQERIDVDDSRR
jgi:uncharacterized protein (TIGR02271 family)